MSEHARAGISAIWLSNEIPERHASLSGCSTAALFLEIIRHNVCVHKTLELAARRLIAHAAVDGAAGMSR